MSKPLRFAALIRVSTEKQAQKGESLRTQKLQIDSAVAALGGKITANYAGQEHGTANWEREQLDKLLADAAKKPRPFDAVIVADATRWSRDNKKSQEGLETLRDNGVRFFVLGTEHDLFKPEARLFLAMTATIGAYHAHTQKLKSLQNRIERAKRGVPTSGKLPFGRIWNAARKQWSIDPTKQAMIVEVADRYLAGEQLPRLAKEFGVNHANLCKVLRERCGDRWTQEFQAKDLNINEKVTLTIPRLLPEKTERAVQHRLEANRTYAHKPPVSIHGYLLTGCIFCGECGYSLCGQTNPNRHRYYRHKRTGGAEKCPLRPRPWVPADRIEAEVVHELFQLLGNPASIERAIKAAIPDCDRLVEKRERLEVELTKKDKARNRLLDLIEKDAITDEQAAKKLHDLKESEVGLRAEMEKVNLALADLPGERGIGLFVEPVGPNPGDVVIMDYDGNTYAGGNDLASFLSMDNQDRRKLIEAAFAGRQPDGKPAGIYLLPASAKGGRSRAFSFKLAGRLFPIGKLHALP